MNLLLDLFLTFAKVGLFTFGGGYAMIALIENTCVEKKQWITHDEMMNITVIAESTPGPIAINCATYVGYKQKGFAGALTATIGMILPSFCIIFAISKFLDHFLEITWIAHAFQGIKIAVGILILDAAVKMLQKMQKKPMPLTFMLCAFAAMFLINIDQPRHLHGEKISCEGRCREMILLELFIGFLRVGCFAFGGAYGAIPLIRDVVLSYGWLDEEMLTYMIAVSESTPGPIMVNLATYVGSSQAGIPGALIATIAVVLPSFIIILLVTALLKTVLKNPYVQAALRGLKPCMIGIILATGVYMIIRNGIVIQEKVILIRPLILTLMLALIYFGSRKISKNGISPIMLICISAIAGAALYGL